MPMFLATVRHQPHSRCPHREHENGFWSYPRDSLSTKPHDLETEHLKATGSRTRRWRSQPPQPFLPTDRFVRAFSPGKCKQAVQMLPDYLFFFPFFFLQTYSGRRLLDHSHRLLQLSEDILSQLANQPKPFAERGPGLVIFFSILTKN